MATRRLSIFFLKKSLKKEDVCDGNGESFAADPCATSGVSKVHVAARGAKFGAAICERRGPELFFSTHPLRIDHATHHSEQRNRTTHVITVTGIVALLESITAPRHRSFHSCAVRAQELDP